MSNYPRALLEKLLWLGRKVVKPLKRGEGPNKFRLSSRDTATTTIDGSVGWRNRPPAALECPQCENEIFHVNSLEDIECQRCTAEFDHKDFPELELLYMECPVCKTHMHHGQRHPERFDFPEWATCDGCRYHWEFKHSY